jgi:hypothetical protein
MTRKGKVRVVFDNGQAVALVRAVSEAQAITHYLRDRFEAPIADQDHMLQYAGKFAVSDATVDPAPELPLDAPKGPTPAELGAAVGDALNAMVRSMGEV